MFARRTWFWLGAFNWWAVIAIVAAGVAITLAVTDASLSRVLAVGVGALVLAILSPKEPL
jgi:hypothetical protein